MALFCLIHVIKWTCHARGLEPQAAITIAARYTCVCLRLLLWHQSAGVGSLTERCHRGPYPASRLWFNLLNNTWDRFSCCILARAFLCAFSSCVERQESKVLPLQPWRWVCSLLLLSESSAWGWPVGLSTEIDAACSKLVVRCVCVYVCVRVRISANLPLVHSHMQVAVVVESPFFFFYCGAFPCMYIITSSQ